MNQDESRELPDLHKIVEFAEDVAIAWSKTHGWLVAVDEARSIANLAVGELVINWDESKVYRSWHPIVAARVKQRLVDELRRELGRHTRYARPISLEEWARLTGAGLPETSPSADGMDHLDELGRTDGYPQFALAYLDSLGRTGEGAWGKQRPRMRMVLEWTLAGLSQDQMAPMLGVTPSRVSRLVTLIKEDYLCWIGDVPCGRNRQCPRCVKVHREQQAITTRKNMLARERRRFKRIKEQADAAVRSLPVQ